MNLTADDRLDILQLMARYSWAADSNDAVAFAATYAADAEVLHRDAATGSPATVLTRGRNTIEAGLSENYKLRAGGQHQTHNHVITVVGGIVHHRCFWSLVRPTEDGLKTLAMGAYEDELVKDPQHGWLFARRTIVTGFPPQ
jgi:hypothetical protein